MELTRCNFEEIRHFFCLFCQPSQIFKTFDNEIQILTRFYSDNTYLKLI